MMKKKKFTISIKKPFDKSFHLSIMKYEQRRFYGGSRTPFWQADFAMAETGFTRDKNAGNILMKNLMDFCISTVVFILIGFGLLLGEDLLGFIGKPGFDMFTAYADFDWSSFVFNLVFCATTATIISSAMAERTKVNAFPGHNLTIGCLGVFILWLDWYGFNGAACTSVKQLGSVFVTTTIAPAIATVVCMILTWLKYGKPDVSGLLVVFGI